MNDFLIGLVAALGWLAWLFTQIRLDRTQRAVRAERWKASALEHLLRHTEDELHECKSKP